METGNSSTGTQDTDTTQTASGTTADTSTAAAQTGQEQGSSVDTSSTAVREDANREAQPSGAKDAVEVTLADVVKNAVEPKDAKTTPESSDREASQETGASDKGEGEQTGDKPNGEPDPKKDDTDVPFHKHPRWQEKLRKERELTRQVETFKQGHDQYEQINAYMQANNLTSEEVANGFKIMAMLRNDPEAALAALQPYVSQLETVTGRKLPEDLQQRVDDGVDTIETAREAARLRHEAARSREAADRAARSESETRERTQLQDRTRAIQSAVSVVEGEIQSGDPDYARKQPFVMDRVRALIVEKQPTTPEEATAIVRQAHSEISDRLKPMIQRRPVQTVTSADSATHSRAEPKTLLEVVRQAAAQ